MRRTVLIFSLLHLFLVTAYAQAVNKTNRKVCKKPIGISKTVSQKQRKYSEQGYARYLKQKGTKGFKEAIGILKTAIPDQGTNLEKRIAAKKISDSARVTQEHYIKQQNNNLNKYGINDKALTALIGVATADRLAPFYIAGRFTKKDLDAVECYISNGGRDEQQIQCLLNMA